MTEKKGVALVPSGQIHYIDHLGPISTIMSIPILFVDVRDYELAKRYYPSIKAELLQFDAFNPEYLISNYDVLFMSDLWDRNVFKQKYHLLEKKYGKSLRNVHCPHGFSDKGYYIKKAALEDITLIYGENMLDQLKHEGMSNELHQYVISGNYRYTYYKQYKPFYELLYEAEIKSKFMQELTTILYAPTWLDVEQSTSFFDAYDFVFGHLPDTYNLIVKLHPRLEQDNPGLYYHILGKYSDRPNILFLSEFTPIFPLLEHTNLYLGDMSSIGYDFIIFNRPMFFLNMKNYDPQKDREAYLFRCGIEIKPNDFGNLYSFIERNLQQDTKQFGEIRRQVWSYTFGNEISFSELKNSILRELTYSPPI